MDYTKIKIKFLEDFIIKERADLFRKKYWDDTIPIEIEEIIDLKMQINVIPIPAKGLGDAFITSKWDNIYVDYDKYSDERYTNRLRFSLAHEIGHFVLHKGIYNTFKINTLIDFYKFIIEIPQKEYWALEYQANRFANHLLIPRNQLIIEKDKVIKEKNGSFNKIDKKVLNSYLAIPLSEIFGVSEDPIAIALNDIS
jgi:Zn-dependent peptidase ImmA (M78 family)